MNKEAYTRGFVKRACEHGLSEQEARELLKSAVSLFGDVGHHIDTTLTGAAKGISDFWNTTSDILPRAWKATKNIANKARYAVTDPIVESYHKTIDPFKAGFKAYDQQQSMPYIPTPAHSQFKGPPSPNMPAPVETALDPNYLKHASYLEGFTKRASELGYSREQAVSLLNQK